MNRKLKAIEKVRAKVTQETASEVKRINIEAWLRTSNSAFEDDFDGEIEKIAQQIKQAIISLTGKRLKDTNGNQVGSVDIKTENA